MFFQYLPLSSSKERHVLESLFGYWLGSYGHAVHEWFAGDPKDFEDLTWKGLDGQQHTAEVDPSWVANIKGQQVAGKLEYGGHTVWIKCNKNGRCTEKTESEAKEGGWGTPLTPYKNVAYNWVKNTDLKDNDSICVRKLGIVTISDHGSGGGAHWLDLYIGEHGPNWDSLGSQNRIWVLRPVPRDLDPCTRDLCPI